MSDGSSTSPSSETVTLKLPTGEDIDAIVPSGMADDEVKQFVQSKRPDLFTPKPQLPGALNPKFDTSSNAQALAEGKTATPAGVPTIRGETGSTTLTEALKDGMRPVGMGAATVAPMMTGGMSVPAQMLVSAGAGAAQSKLLGGSNKEAAAAGAFGAALPAALPTTSYVLRQLKDMIDPETLGTAAKVAGYIPGQKHVAYLLGKIADLIEKNPELEEKFPGAPLPAKPSEEVLQGQSLGRGSKVYKDPAAGLSRPVPNPKLPRGQAELREDEIIKDFLRHDESVEEQKANAIRNDLNTPGVSKSEMARRFKEQSGGDLTEILQKGLDKMKEEKTANYVYRARPVGEKGINPEGHAHATSSMEWAKMAAEPGQQQAGRAGEVVKIDLNKLKPEDYAVREGPNGERWVKFNRPIDESEISPLKKGIKAKQGGE